eukprot:jgi/Psemu1/310660/fgenesh1_kg.662_\
MEEEGYEVSAQKINAASIMRPMVPKKQPEPSGNDENKPAVLPQTYNPSQSADAEKSVRSAVKQFEVKRQQGQQQQPFREIKPTNSSIGIETILGAKSRDSSDDEKSQVSTSFLQSRSIFSPNMRKSRNSPTNESQTYGFGKVNVQVQGQDARSETSHSTLGARPRENQISLSSVMRRAGRYDVYAPSGPIGIVVDTSKDGPSVHSIKPTSPMLGLISPGDLIVALDGEDTRKMTAAALTRLMSLKSRQKDRKITLLSK